MDVPHFSFTATNNPNGFFLSYASILPGFANFTADTLRNDTGPLNRFTTTIHFSNGLTGNALVDHGIRIAFPEGGAALSPLAQEGFLFALSLGAARATNAVVAGGAQAFIGGMLQIDEDRRNSANRQGLLDANIYGDLEMRGVVISDRNRIEEIIATSSHRTPYRIEFYDGILPEYARFTIDDLLCPESFKLVQKNIVRYNYRTVSGD